MVSAICVLLTLLSALTVHAASQTEHVTSAKPSIQQSVEQSALQLTTHLKDTDLYDAVVDSRPLASCRQSSLANAMCLPAEDVLAPNRRLANWSGILWLLGSSDLTGSEHVLVVGQRPGRRLFIAGLLLLAGQHRVTVMETPVSKLIEASSKTLSGSARATTRTSVFTAPMRSELIVLQSDLKSLISSNAVILDGRSENEYYGTTVYGARGGHIPGAILSPLHSWRSNSEPTDTYHSINPIVYAHDAFESIVYLATLHAAGVNARVYLAGWAEWATNATLPADSVSYPTDALQAKGAQELRESNPASAASGVASGAMNNASRTGLVSAAAMVVICLLVASFYTGRKFSGKAI